MKRRRWIPEMHSPRVVGQLFYFSTFVDRSAASLSVLELSLSLRGVGPPGVGTLARRFSNDSSVEAPLSTAATSASVNGISCHMRNKLFFCLQAAPSRCAFGHVERALRTCHTVRALSKEVIRAVTMVDMLVLATSPRKIWRRGSDSNRRVMVLQTIPLGHLGTAPFLRSQRLTAITVSPTSDLLPNLLPLSDQVFPLSESRKCRDTPSASCRSALRDRWT